MIQTEPFLGNVLHASPEEATDFVSIFRISYTHSLSPSGQCELRLEFAMRNLHSTHGAKQDERNA
jgi:hypothetical protein